MINLIKMKRLAVLFIVPSIEIAVGIVRTIEVCAKDDKTALKKRKETNAFNSTLFIPHFSQYNKKEKDILSANQLVSC